MSKLYTWINSDTVKTTHTVRGNQELRIRVNYGSKSDSKPLLEVNIFYRKGEVKPTLSIQNHLEEF